MNDVPVLVTYDIHLGTHSAQQVERYLQTVLEVLARFGIKASFLFPAEAARLLQSTVRSLIAHGHEVGNHGLTHGPGEIYNTLPTEAQEERLRQATEEVAAVTQQPVRFFRAPAFRISGTTIRVLEELGYEAELSMNSQRLGLLSSDPWNASWMVAPRGPYHPDVRHPWRKGATRMWEIPLSCALLPFMSNTLLMFGLGFMKAFFSALYREAQLRGTPVVFMTHPEEFEPHRETIKKRPVHMSDFLPLRYGFGFRHALMENDPAIIARNNITLLEHMRSTPQVKFFTVSEYVRRLNGAAKAVMGREGSSQTDLLLGQRAR